MYEHQDPNSVLIYSKKTSEKKTMASMVAVGVIMLSGLIQVINWDKHALAVIPLQAQILFGSATAHDYAEFAKICLDRQKQECALNSLKMQVKLSPADPEALLQLGLLQAKTQDLKPAIQTLERYLEQGGAEPQAKYQLAKAYAKTDETKKALQIFNQLLAEKNNVFQVSVTREYVQTLMQAKQWGQAKRSIERARLKSASHNAFMTAEYKYVLNKIGGRSLASQ